MNLLVFIFLTLPFRLLRKILNFCEYLYYRFFYSKPTLNFAIIQNCYLLCASNGSHDIAKNYILLFSQKVNNKIDQADLICQHAFDLLGSGRKNLSPLGDGYQPIDWHIDYKSGYRWNPKTFYRNIRYGDLEGVDVKVPLELSRFQHLNTLGQAYILTKNLRYAQEFTDQITDWIENNPVGFGVNWSCTMDVAIRAANWLVAMEYFSQQGVLLKQFVDEFYTSIYEHGRFIRRHLERGKITQNHYLANIAGLFFIAVYCPFFAQSKQWLPFSIKELTKEMKKQVYEDGCDFEGSTSYHRLALEMFFYCILLADRASIRLPVDYKGKLRKMFDVSLYCIKPNGMVPQIGDNDGGRFLVFARRPILEHKYLLTLALIYYEDSFFNIPYFYFDEEAFWLFGFNGKKLYDKLPSRMKPVASRSFPYAGWFIFRQDNDYCFISCGPNGQNGKGGHAHNDKLSFELMLDGQDVIVDPGTYVYTSNSEERNKFRSTKYHNTVNFPGYEQNEIPEKDMFSLPDRVRIREAALKEGCNNSVFQGEIQYTDIVHKRRVTLDKKSGNFHIQDSISSPKSLNGKLTFYLSPNLTNDGNDILIKNTNAKIATIEIQGYSFKKAKYDYSPEYGVKVKAGCLIADISATEDAEDVDIYIRKMK